MDACSTLSYASAASPTLLSGIHANNKSDRGRARELLAPGDVGASSCGFCCNSAIEPGRLSRALGEGC